MKRIFSRKVDDGLDEAQPRKYGWFSFKNEHENRPPRKRKAVGRTSPSGKAKSTWRLASVVDHVTFAGAGGEQRMVAWFLADPQQWSFRSQSEGRQLIMDQAETLAELVGATLHIRVTHRPYPVPHWAAAAWRNAPNPQPGFEPMMTRDQIHMMGSAQWDKLVYYGVDLGARGSALSVLSKVHRGVVDREVRALKERLHTLAQVMAGPGIAADPATPKDMDWLLARSFALGCPIPMPDPAEEMDRVLTEDDLAGFAASTHWAAEPLAPCVQVTTSANGGEQVTRYVCVLTVAKVTEIDIPAKHEPWMAKADRLPFPVEWSCRIDVRTPESVAKEMGGLSKRVDGQVDHWSVDHGKRPPKQLARQAARIGQVEDEMRAGFTGLSTRTQGWYRMAVSGATEKEALDRAAKVIELYRPQIRIVRELGQFHMAKEFVPGELLANRAHARKWPVVKVAAGLPAITAEVGDKRGFQIGETTGLSSRAVVMDPWFLTEKIEVGGLIPVVGGLGSGKSIFMFMMAYKATMAGTRGVIMDPSGRVRKMLQLPEMKGISNNIDLLGGLPGSLSPYAVVPDPHPELVRLECDDPNDDVEFKGRWRRAVAAAESARRDLAIDALRYCLPYEMGQNPEVRAEIRKAIAANKADSKRSLNEPMSWMDNKGGPGAKDIVVALKLAQKRELGRLFFHETGQDRGYHYDSDALLTAFNLRGLVQPKPNTPMEDWSPDELLSRPIMSLASWAALQLIYRRDPNERKLFCLDEAHEITEGSAAGQALVTKVSTDSRKNNTAAFIGTQNASKVLGANSIANFAGACFVGRTTDEQAQKDALALLGKPENAGYESLLGALSPKQRDGSNLPYREFIYRDGLGGADGRGGMEMVRISLMHHPDLYRSVFTTADGRSAETRAAEAAEAAGAPDPTLDDGQEWAS